MREVVGVLMGKLAFGKEKLSLRGCGFGRYSRNSRREEDILPRTSFSESYAGWVEEHKVRKRELAILVCFGFPLIVVGIFLLFLHFSGFSDPGFIGVSGDISFNRTLSAFSDPIVITLGDSLVVIGLGLSFLAVLAIARLVHTDREISSVAYTSPAAGEANIVGLCVYCNTLITIHGSRFCPGCGARLIRLDEGDAVLASIGKAVVGGATPVVSAEQAAMIAKALRVHKGERAGTCMVCELDLRSSDHLAWCPHCGNPAHRSHLVEWVRVRRKCPMCGEHLDEEELAEQLSRSDLQRRGTRGTGKPTSL